MFFILKNIKQKTILVVKSRRLFLNTISKQSLTFMMRLITWLLRSISYLFIYEKYFKIYIQILRSLYKAVFDKNVI